MNAGKKNAQVGIQAASVHRLMSVAHIHQVFFPRSETFIYHAVTHLRRYKPLFVAWEFDNMDQFPIDPGACFSLAAPQWSLSWFRQGLGRRLLKRELLAEHFLNQQQACLLHAHFGPNGVRALQLKRALHIPMATTFYGQDVSMADLVASYKNGYRHLFREGDLFFVEGPHMRARLMELGCPEQKIALQHIAIPVNNIPFRHRLPKRRGDRVILAFTGRFVEKKGLLPALYALLEIHREHPTFEFRIIGDGPLRPHVEDFIRRHDMTSYIHLLGFLRHGEYMEQLNKADLFLHPSVTASDGDGEGGAPTTILEAQALGLPVISTNHADIPYIVVPGESALLSREGDLEGLMANIIRLLEEQTLWARMGEIGRRLVESSHDVNQEIRKLELAYDGLIHYHEPQNQPNRPII